MRSDAAGDGGFRTSHCREIASRRVCFTDLVGLGRLRTARFGTVSSGDEGASRRKAPSTGARPSIAANGGRQSCPASTEKAARVGVLRSQNRPNRSLFDDAAGVHDGDAVAVSAMTPRSCVISSSERLKLPSCPQRSSTCA